MFLNDCSNIAIFYLTSAQKGVKLERNYMRWDKGGQRGQSGDYLFILPTYSPVVGKLFL